MKQSLFTWVKEPKIHISPSLPHWLSECWFCLYDVIQAWPCCYWVGRLHINTTRTNRRKQTNRQGKQQPGAHLPLDLGLITYINLVRSLYEFQQTGVGVRIRNVGRGADRIVGGTRAGEVQMVSGTRARQRCGMGRGRGPGGPGGRRSGSPGRPPVSVHRWPATRPSRPNRRPSPVRQSPNTQPTQPSQPTFQLSPCKKVLLPNFPSLNTMQKTNITFYQPSSVLTFLIFPLD